MAIFKLLHPELYLRKIQESYGKSQKIARNRILCPAVELSDGRASLYLEYYLGSTKSPVLDEDGNQVFYTEGAMAENRNTKIKHSRKKENLNLYIWL